MASLSLQSFSREEKELREREERREKRVIAAIMAVASAGKRKRVEEVEEGKGKEGGDRKENTRQTKLERLLKLVKDGSSREIRTAAAKQLAKLIHVSPEQVLHILNKVKQLLYDRRWDTRCAAAVCLENLAERCAAELFGKGSENDADQTEKTETKLRLPISESDEKEKGSEGERKASSGSRNKHVASLMEETCFSFGDLKLEQLLSVGTPLLANSGKEYDVEEYGADLTEDEKLKQARMRLDKNIGLSGAATFFDSTEIVSNHDLMMATVKVEDDDKRSIAVGSLMAQARKKTKIEEGGGPEKYLPVFHVRLPLRRTGRPDPPLI